MRLCHLRRHARALALCLAAALAFADVARVVHGALVRHAACDAHAGQVLDVEHAPSATAHAHEDATWCSTPPAAHAHEHCVVASFGAACAHRDDTHVAAVAVVRDVRARDGAGSVIVDAVYRLAPKTSPPRA